MRVDHYFNRICFYIFHEGYFWATSPITISANNCKEISDNLEVPVTRTNSYTIEMTILTNTGHDIDISTDSENLTLGLGNTGADLNTKTIKIMRGSRTLKRIDIITELLNHQSVYLDDFIAAPLKQLQEIFYGSCSGIH